MLYSKRLTGPQLVVNALVLAGTVPAGKRWVVMNVIGESFSGAAQTLSLWLGNSGALGTLLMRIHTNAPPASPVREPECRLTLNAGESLYMSSSLAAGYVVNVDGYELDA